MVRVTRRMSSGSERKDTQADAQRREGRNRRTPRLSGLRRSPRPREIVRAACLLRQILRERRTYSSDRWRRFRDCRVARPSCSIIPVADRAEKSHGDQDEIRVHGEFGAGDRIEFRRRSNPDRVKLFHISVLVAGKFVVAMLQSRMPPSSCAASVRSCIGHKGHGVSGERSSGGLGMISN